MSLLVDSNEPLGMVGLLKQLAPAYRSELNQVGIADYFFFDAAGKSNQIERKQWGELLTSIDAVEQQLSREIPKADNTSLLIEGHIRPTPYGIDVYKASSSKAYMSLQHRFGSQAKPRTGLYSMVCAWLWQLDKTGVTIMQTPDLESTAVMVGACYKNCQKLEHTTLKRYIKLRPYVASKNPHVLSLMGLEKAGLGEKKAEQLIAKYDTLWGVLNADIKEIASLPGFGYTTALKIFQSVGREM